jgi:hypothetical protein
MATRTYIVKDGQNLQDVGIMLHGSVSGAVYLAAANGVSPSAQLAAGQVLYYDDTIILNSDLVSQISGQRLVLNTDRPKTPLPLPIVTLAAPVITSPVDEGTYLATATPVNWDAVSGATSYDYEVWPDNLFSNTPFQEGNTSALTFTIGNILTVIYVRVRARNASGVGAWAVLGPLYSAA